MSPTLRVIHGDCLEVIPRLVAEGITVDSVVTDPPYHLLPTVNRFQKSSIGGSQVIEQKAKKRADAIGRLSGGFMGSAWDGGDLAFRPETWATIATVLRPGGFLLAFGGTRTWHRLACAIEDAGFILQDTLMFLYGSGFPKRRDALKPSYEPIIMAYKPAGKRTLQVDECRIGTADGMGNLVKQHDEKQSPNGWGTRKFEVDDTVRGRYPANVCHDGSEEVLSAFAAFGERSGCQPHQIYSKNEKYDGWGSITNKNGEQVGYEGSGTAARFFYTAKADEVDRLGSQHPTVKPLELLRWLVPLVTPKGGTVLDPFAGTGTTGIAAKATGRNAILIERDEGYVADIHRRVEFFGIRGSRRRARVYSTPDGRLF